MKIGIPKESKPGETRVAMTPATVKKLAKKGFQFVVERSAGTISGFDDEQYTAEGAQIVDAAGALGADIVVKFSKPSREEIGKLKKGAILISFLEPYAQDGTIEALAQAGASAFSMELIPRTSRAQAMDALSSQANIAGFRAVIEAQAHYVRFFPLMMTSAGSAKAAKLTVLGAGVAGLQAIATARRLGAQVEAYDVRPEVKEQILSLGAKFIDIDVGEEGSGQGGYAKELSEEGKRKLQAGLNDRLKKSDIIISTANVPGRKAPTLISEEVVKGMRPGSVIVDMAAPSGGNCPLTKADQVVVSNGVKIIGHTNFPSLMPADSSGFYAGNLANLLGLIAELKEGKVSVNLNLEDDIIEAALVTHQGQVRKKRS